MDELAAKDKDVAELVTSLHKLTRYIQYGSHAGGRCVHSALSVNCPIASLPPTLVRASDGEVEKAVVRAEALVGRAQLFRSLGLFPEAQQDLELCVSF